MRYALSLSGIFWMQALLSQAAPYEPQAVTSFLPIPFAPRVEMSRDGEETLQLEYSNEPTVACLEKQLMNPDASAANTETDRAVQQSQKIVADEFKWPRMQLQIDPSSLDSAAAEVSLCQALQSGLEQVLDDLSSPETPLAIALHAWALKHAHVSLKEPLQASTKRDVQDFLREHLNRESSRLALFTGPESKVEKDKGEGKGGGSVVYPPEQGESPRENWIFNLDIPSLSDHIYWIVVDKSGEDRSYVYGFN